ncbi:Flp family type IVb pilin [Aeromicrobium sp. NPDC092404]|uniref:Flp family type IVb pilin n=1 Tax=Aeromicrobium sp. NPDC092404 TaxID=3154976 RepID=UPI0034184FDF
MKIRMRRRTDERGVTAVEYALVIGLVSLVVIGAAVSLGSGFTTWAATLVDLVSDLLGV